MVKRLVRLTTAACAVLLYLFVFSCSTTLTTPTARANDYWLEPDDAEEFGDEPFLQPERSRYLQVETVLLGYRMAASDQPVVIRSVDENSTYPGPTLINTTDVMLGFQAGPQITWGVLNEQGDGWETRYFSLLGGGQQAVATGDNDVSLPGTLGLNSISFFNADQISVAAVGDLHSIEVNRLRQWGGLTFSAGVRYVRLYDRMTFTSDDNETDTFAVYDLRTANNLFGGQLGVRRDSGAGRLRWQAGAKVGLYGNASTHNQSITDFPNPEPPFFLREWCPRSNGGLAFVGEMEFGLSYAISDRWSIRGGYRMLWMEGVGLSGNQLNFADVPSFDIGFSTSGGVFLQGASLGFEAAW
ncbi:MAG: hypothetical protein ACKO38_06825 [Planctomycetota bacterium]